MTDLKYFKIIYFFLLLIFFAFNYYNVSEVVFNENYNAAENPKVKGITKPSYEPFIIENAEILEKGILKIPNLKYVNDNETSKKLDLYLPEKMYKDQKYPLIIYVHGGAWLEGDKEYFMDYEFIKHDFIVASVDYRLSSEDLFPAQIHDVKAALRWLRAHASDYNIDTDNIGAYGESAGGHLAALLGTTADNDELNGDVGQNLDQANNINAVASEFGLPNFESIAKQCDNNPNCRSLYRVSDSIISKLLGCNYHTCGDKLKNASPYNYISAEDAAFIQFHGKKDSIVPYEQAQEFHDKLLVENIYSETYISDNGVHIDGDDREQYLDHMVDFFDWRLKQEKYYFCAYDPYDKEIYKDIAKTSPYFEAVNKISCKHGFYGFDDAEFGLEKELTRSEAARILSIIFDVSQDSSCENFEDMDKYNKDYIFVQSLKCNEITKGYTNNEFKPDNIITDLELLHMIAKIKETNLDEVINKVKQSEIDENHNELNRGDAAKIISLFV